jgi:hypothetical protein
VSFFYIQVIIKMLNGKILWLIVCIIYLHSHFIIPKSICSRQRISTTNILENKIVSTTVPISYIPYYWDNSHQLIPAISTINILITTTPNYYKFCTNFNGASSIFGKPVHGLKANLVQVKDLKSIIVHSGEFVNAITFNFNDENSKTFGSLLNLDINSNSTIDLIGKHISSINIRHGLWINSLQFVIYDHLTKKATITNEFGGSGGSQTSINKKRMTPYESNAFQITSFRFSADSFYVRTLAVGFNYDLCPLLLFK